MKLLKLFYRFFYKSNYDLSDKITYNFGRFGNTSVLKSPGDISMPELTYIGENTVFEKGSRIENYYLSQKVSENKSLQEELNNEIKIVIGDNCYFNQYFTCLNASQVIIGNNVLVGGFVFISSENHGFDPESFLPYSQQNLSSKKIEIKDNVWIGEKVCILPGVTIGEYSVIGAGSVVTKCIAPYCMACGNPAKVIKRYNIKTQVWERV